MRPRLCLPVATGDVSSDFPWDGGARIVLVKVEAAIGGLWCGQGSCRPRSWQPGGRCRWVLSRLKTRLPVAAGCCQVVSANVVVGDCHDKSCGGRDHSGQGRGGQEFLFWCLAGAG